MCLQVIAQLLGEEQLPWEVHNAADRRNLGAFRGPIMRLLSRDPSDRPSMLEFYQACTSVFTSSTTYEHVKRSVETLSDTDGRGAGTAAQAEVDDVLGASRQTVTETMYMTEVL